MGAGDGSGGGGSGTVVSESWRADEELLQRLREGDPAARREMVVELWPEAKGYAYHLLGRDQEVEDVLQETFSAALAGVSRFQGKSRLKSWVFSILRNKVADLLAARTRTREREQPLEPDPLAGRFDDRGMWNDPPDETLPDPESVAHGKEIRETIEEAVQELPDLQKEVFLLRDVQGFSGKEVCNILDIKPTHQRVLLHRARVALREVLVETGHR